MADELDEIDPGTVVTAADWWNPMARAVNRNSANSQSNQTGLADMDGAVSSVQSQADSLDDRMGEVERQIADGNGGSVSAGRAETLYQRIEDSGAVTLRSTSWADLSVAKAVSFRPPPSGTIKLTVGGDMVKNSGSWGALGFRIGTSENGREILGPGVDRCAQQQSGSWLSFAAPFIITDLDPGEQFWARLMSRVGSGTLDINRPFLMIEPVLA